jgi:hypothetical protein
MPWVWADVFSRDYVYCSKYVLLPEQRGGVACVARAASLQVNIAIQ